MASVAPEGKTTERCPPPRPKEAEVLEVREAIDARTSRDLPFDFEWNQRKCLGNELHQAVVEGNAGEAAKILRQQPALIDVRFRYYTSKGEGRGFQEGSGHAIHIAASRASFELTRVLLAARASLDSWVTRGGEDHYNVLQAGVFNEGQGGNAPYVKFLLELKADMQKNLLGFYPLHTAFQVGNIDVIRVVREECQRRAMVDIEDGLNGATPLEVAIMQSGMRDEQLVEAAPLTPVALQAFTKLAPRCIPMWLERLNEAVLPQGMAMAEYLATQLNVRDIGRVLCECPHAGDALLRSLLSPPAVMNVALNPVPPKVNFGAQDWYGALYGLVNLRVETIVTMSEDNVWNYDGTMFSKPAWQAAFTGRVGKESIRDTDIRVCHVPNLVDAEFFCGLAHAGDSDPEVLGQVFENPVISGLISHVWWRAAYKVEVVRLVLNVVGLVLLIADLCLTRGISIGAGRDEARQLLGVGSAGSPANFHVDAFSPHREGARIGLVWDFVVAKGILLSLHELACVAGSWGLATKRQMFMSVSYPVLLQGVVSLTLCLPPSVTHNTQTAACVLITFMYWGGLLRVQMLSEMVAYAILPLVDLIKGLVPSIVLTAVGFLSYTHVLLYLHPERDMLDTAVDSFTTLFTGGVPDVSGNPLDTLIACVIVFLFTIFFLNIFIGVITELYSALEAGVRLRSRQLMADACKCYLLRLRVLPVPQVSPRVGWSVAAVAFAVGAGLQVWSMVRGKPVRCLGVWLFACMSCMLGSAYAQMDSRWCRRGSPDKKMYLWIASEQKVKPPRSPNLDDITALHDTMRLLLADNAKIHELLERVAPHMGVHLDS